MLLFLGFCSGLKMCPGVYPRGGEDENRRVFFRIGTANGQFISLLFRFSLTCCELETPGKGCDKPAGLHLVKWAPADPVRLNEGLWKTCSNL